MNCEDIILFCVLYILAYIYCLEVAPLIPGYKNEPYNTINMIHESCIFNNNFLKALTYGRGKNYYINSNASFDENCIVTFWGLTHFLFHIIVGFFFPYLFWQVFVIGVGFEIYEYFAYDCADPLDIVLNTAGFIVGSYLNDMIVNYWIGAGSMNSL
jgi:hypothetical protein